MDAVGRGGCKEAGLISMMPSEPTLVFQLISFAPAISPVASAMSQAGCRCVGEIGFQPKRSPGSGGSGGSGGGGGGGGTGVGVSVGTGVGVGKKTGSPQISGVNRRG